MISYRIVHASCVVLALVTSGCISVRGGSEAAHTYQLSLEGAQREVHAADGNSPVVQLSPPQAEPGFETPRMVYLKRPYELEYFAANQWADTPANMVAPLLAQSLSQSGIWRDVVLLPSLVPGDYRLDVYGFALQQEFFQQPSRVRVTARAQLVDLKLSMIVGMQRFEAIEPAPSENAYGGVVAANRAVAALLDQITVWLRECVGHSPTCRRSM
ncbi:ABC-type transport auxiliary lipoprotein family protein [Nitrospira sp. BLG_1]|uniref:ABC-type transport auxiliary lipoprotein family protein n=1 Tax=Nitrospira sp. BLG_1 TaxID=3395883 RepID=UPI0039BC4442